jgi:hypothetical protein
MGLWKSSEHRDATDRCVTSLCICQTYLPQVRSSLIGVSVCSSFRRLASVSRLPLSGRLNAKVFASESDNVDRDLSRFFGDCSVGT